MVRVARKRPCRYCRCWFALDPRLKERQRACSAQACQQRRQAENQTAWLDRHPGYFRDREVAHREWRRQHPEAQRQWRAAHPAAVAADRAARKLRRQRAATQRAVEQEAMALQMLSPSGVADRVAGAGEQESMRAQDLVLLGLASRVPPADEQESIEGALRHWHAVGRRLLRGANAQAS